jgi:hypothetical protein
VIGRAKAAALGWKIAAGVIAGAAAVWLVNDVVLFDADAFVKSWHDEVMESAWAGTLAQKIRVDDAEVARRAAWHQGEPPCFTYAPQLPSPDAIRAIVDDMEAAGVLEQARATFAVWGHWSSLDEMQRHGEPRDEEVLAGFKYAGPRRRFLVALNRSKVLAAARRRMRAEETEMRQKLSRREQQYAPEDLAAAYSFWKTRRLALPIHALLKLRREMDARAASKKD